MFKMKLIVLFLICYGSFSESRMVIVTWPEMIEFVHSLVSNTEANSFDLVIANQTKIFELCRNVRKAKLFITEYETDLTSSTSAKKFSEPVESILYLTNDEELEFENIVRTFRIDADTSVTVNSLSCMHLERSKKHKRIIYYLSGGFSESSYFLYGITGRNETPEIIAIVEEHQTSILEKKPYRKFSTTWENIDIRKRKEEYERCSSLAPQDYFRIITHVYAQLFKKHEPGSGYRLSIQRTTENWWTEGSVKLQKKK